MTINQYSRSINRFHKYEIIPPERIHVDMRFRGTSNSPAQATGHLILYRIEGKQNDDSSDVYDNVFEIANGKIKFIIFFQEGTVTNPAI